MPRLKREERFDPLVYCGGKGPSACPVVTEKTAYVPPQPAPRVSPDPSVLMNDMAQQLAGNAPVPVVPPAKPAAFQNILFAFDRSSLSVDAKQQLDAVVDQLYGKSMELRGFTDFKGAETYNNRLALRRAEAVKAYLQKKGIPAKNILIQGDGLCCYIAPNDSEENRQLNRRVEIHLKKD